MMRQSWSENHEVPLLYTEEFLASAFHYPESSFELAPSVYSGDDLVAFIAGFPRRMRRGGRDYRFLINTFLTAASDTKGTGYGLALWGGLAQRGRKAGFDGALNFCVEGDDMNRMILSLSTLLRQPTKQIYTVRYLSRFLRPTPGEPEPPFQDVDLFLELAAAIPEATELARTWTRAEAQWQCCDRYGAIAVSSPAGGARGVLSGYVMPVATAPPTPVAIIDDVLWGDLDDEGRQDLVRQFLRVAAARGAQTISVPVLGYAAMEPFRAAGFRPSRRVLCAYLTAWTEVALDPVPSLYIDVV
jgi:hypothetical protein